MCLTCRLAVSVKTTPNSHEISSLHRDLLAVIIGHVKKMRISRSMDFEVKLVLLHSCAFFIILGGA